MMAVVVAKAAILGMLQARGRVCTFNAVGRARAEPQKKMTGTVSGGASGNVAQDGERETENSFEEAAAARARRSSG
jgi:hypothetical protein